MVRILAVWAVAVFGVGVGVVVTTRPDRPSPVVAAGDEGGSPFGRTAPVSVVPLPTSSLASAPALAPEQAPSSDTPRVPVAPTTVGADSGATTAPPSGQSAAGGGIDEGGLWLIRPDGSGAAHFPDALDLGGSMQAWAGDSNALYVARWFTDADGVQSRSLLRYSLDGTATSMAADGAGGLAVSPDGRYLAAQGNDDGVHVVDTTTRTEVRVVQGYVPVFQSNITLLTEYSGTLSTTDVTTGASTSEPYPYDGPYQLFVGDHDRLVGVGAHIVSWRDASGGSHQSDLGGYVDQLSRCHAAADLSRVACTVQSTSGNSLDLVEVDLSTGATRRIADAGPGTYAPDGRLAYAVADDATRPFRRRVVVEQPGGSTTTLVPASRSGTAELVPVQLDWSPNGSVIAGEFWTTDYGY